MRYSAIVFGVLVGGAFGFFTWLALNTYTHQTTSQISDPGRFVREINQTVTLIPTPPTTASLKAPIIPELAVAPKSSPPEPAPEPVMEKITETNPVAKDGEFPVARIQEPYPYPAQSFEMINTSTRAATVNIFCTAGGSLSPISATGVIIDPRGVIITNAHVAQYVLLQQTTTIPISCRGRIGSPAVDHYALSVLYISPTWIDEHAEDLVVPRPTGTGEHDWALLIATPRTAATSLSYLEPDTREGIAFEGDEVLIAAYPAGFLGGFITSSGLHVSSAVTTIKQLFTFADKGAIDLVSLGGTVLAQSGSSGGAVVNAWGRIVGLVVTSSDAETTAERDLRAITFAHIDRSMREQYATDLETFLQGDLRTIAALFMETTGVKLAEKLTEVLKR